MTAVVPAEQATACLNGLRAHGKAARAAGDTRTLSQIMADTTVERITGQSATNPLPASVGLVMSDLTLLGIDDRPAHLIGYGPIPAAVARWLTAHNNTWVRRLYTDPVDASVATADTHRRRFDGALRELIIARDQTCRTPGCHTTIRDIDHTVPVTADGPTTASNGRGYCRRCHRAKHDPLVHVDRAAQSAPNPIGHDAYTRWLTPTGRVLADIPPPALGVGTTDRHTTHQRRQQAALLVARPQPEPHGSIPHHERSSFTPEQRPDWTWPTQQHAQASLLERWAQEFLTHAN